MTVQEEPAVPATRFRCSPQVGELTAALAKAQGEIENASKDRENQHIHYRYATLAAVWNAIREPLAKNGLAVLQPYVDGYLITRICHGEQWIESEVRVIVELRESREGKQVLTQVQALGSAITYLRRYCLSSLVGVAPDDDDDGAGAEGVDVQRYPEPRRAPQPPPSREPQREPPRQPQPAQEPTTDAEAHARKLLLSATTPAELGKAGVEVSKLQLTPEQRDRCLQVYQDRKASLTPCLSA